MKVLKVDFAATDLQYIRTVLIRQTAISEGVRA